LSAFLNRPDHLTRAAREIERWRDTVSAAARTPLPAGAAVQETTAAGSDGIQFLSDPSTARAASGAILEAVRAARAR
jgi:hypothetical protein